MCRIQEPRDSNESGLVAARSARADRKSTNSTHPHEGGQSPGGQLLLRTHGDEPIGENGVEDRGLALEEVPYLAG